MRTMTHGGHNDDQESVENTRQHQQSAGMSYMFTLSPGTFQPLITWDTPAPDHLIAHNLAISMLDAGQGKDTRGAHMQML